MKILLVNIFFSIYSKIILSEILIRTKLFTKKKFITLVIMVHLGMVIMLHFV